MLGEQDQNHHCRGLQAGRQPKSPTQVGVVRDPTEDQLASGSHPGGEGQHESRSLRREAQIRRVRNHVSQKSAVTAEVQRNRDRDDPEVAIAMHATRQHRVNTLVGRQFQHRLARGKRHERLAPDRFFRRRSAAAVGQEPHVLGSIDDHEPHGRSHEHQREDAEHLKGSAPSEGPDEDRGQRRHDHARQRDTHRGDPESHPALAQKPVGDERRGRKLSHESQADRDHQREDGVELPKRIDARDDQESERRRDSTHRHHLANRPVIDLVADERRKYSGHAEQKRRTQPDPQS